MSQYKSIKFSDLSADDQRIISKTSKLRQLGASENLIIFLLQEYQKMEDDEPRRTANDTAITSTLEFFGEASIGSLLETFETHHKKLFPQYPRLMVDIERTMKDHGVNNWQELLKSMNEDMIVNTSIRKSLGLEEHVQLTQVSHKLNKFIQDHNNTALVLKRMNIRPEHFNTWVENNLDLPPQGTSKQATPKTGASQSTVSVKEETDKTILIQDMKLLNQKIEEQKENITSQTSRIVNIIQEKEKMQVEIATKTDQIHRLEDKIDRTIKDHELHLRDCVNNEINYQKEIDMLRALQNVSPKTAENESKTDTMMTRDEINSHLQKIRELETTISNQDIQFNNALKSLAQEKDDLQTLLNGLNGAPTLRQAHSGRQEFLKHYKRAPLPLFQGYQKKTLKIGYGCSKITSISKQTTTSNLTTTTKSKLLENTCGTMQGIRINEQKWNCKTKIGNGKISKH